MLSETMPYMKAAQLLYKKNGFDYLEGPMGDTGHYECGVNMILDLKDDSKRDTKRISRTIEIDLPKG